MMATTQASPAETGHQMDVYHINWVATDKDGKVVAEGPLKYGTDEKPAQHGGTNTKSWFAHVHEFAKEPIARRVNSEGYNTSRIHHLQRLYVC